MVNDAGLATHATPRRCQYVNVNTSVLYRYTNNNNNTTITQNADDASCNNTDNIL